jgi:hypothetical protein
VGVNIVFVDDNRWPFGWNATVNALD